MSAADDFPVNLDGAASFWPRLGARLLGPSVHRHPKHGPTIAVTTLKGGNGQNYGRRLFQDALYFTGHTNPKYGHWVELAI